MRLLELVQNRLYVRDGHRRNLTCSASLDKDKLASRGVLRNFGRSDFVGVNVCLALGLGPGTMDL